MSSLSYARHRFPPVIIQHAVWLYFRFALSYRDIEDLLAERGIDASYETVRRWVLKFGHVYAREIRLRRLRTSERWHLDEVFLRIGGRIHYLWRAIDDEGEVLDISGSVTPRWASGSIAQGLFANAGATWIADGLLPENVISIIRSFLVPNFCER